MDGSYLGNAQEFSLVVKKKRGRQAGVKTGQGNRPCKDCGQPFRYWYMGSGRCPKCIELRKIKLAQKWLCACGRKKGDRASAVCQVCRESKYKFRKQWCECNGCGKQFYPKVADRTKYCSRECAYTHKAETPFCKVYFPECKYCGKLFTARRDGKSYCGVCPKYKKTQPTAKLCIVCGVRFESKLADRKYCSQRCHRAVYKHTDAGKAIRKAHKLKSKAKRRSKEHSFLDAIRPSAVGDGCGWKCLGCGCDTPKALRGKNLDNSPEIDHIIPLSKGGAHTYDNVQILCRVCNALKSDRSMEEFMNQLAGGRTSRKNFDVNATERAVDFP